MGMGLNWKESGCGQGRLRHNNNNKGGFPSSDEARGVDISSDDFRGQIFRRHFCGYGYGE
ncbi:hypothetical protein PIB30_051782 [Stylosanthes scabra]|uniref:Uncharacterized protein n=1 Tax=Stylosanthes scabra TaxID=79078 RepID=A0ABU6QHF8_9FABA|nr:hypothetical protein [Stylosanthes scabra]